MISDPEWASKEVWDIYAWFGFAIQEAQSLERVLLVIAVTLDMRKDISCSHKDHWYSLYNKFGHLTLGTLLGRIRIHANIPDDLAANLKKAVDIRNNLAHAFFWPQDLEKNERSEKAVQAELIAAASLFSNLFPRLEGIMLGLLDNLEIDRNAAEGQAAILLSHRSDGIDTD